MNSKVRELQYFFYSQNFHDGIRVTVAALLPALVFAYFGHLERGIAMSLGAIGVSLADSPGPLLHKRNGMLVGIGVCTLVTLITGFARMHVVTMGLEILVLSFLFSMFLVYGMRASLIGMGGLLVLVLTMDQPLPPELVLVNSGLTMAGGVWYLLLSLLTNKVMPYRPAQQALGECIREVAKFLRLKAAFYQPNTDLDEGYRQLISQQILVNEKQAAVRELLFRSRQMVKESTQAGRTLVMTFVDLVDLYEQVTAIHYDYDAIRERYGSSGILLEIAHLVEYLAEELDHLGFAVQGNLRPKNRVDTTARLEALKAKIEAVGEQGGQQGNLVLRKIYVNIRSIAQRLSDILSYFKAHSELVHRRVRELELSQFVSRQTVDPKLFWSNLTMASSIFRFSVRVALVALFAYVLTLLFPYGQHSYWVLLTVIFLLKPAFSLTKQRNIQRVIGTVVGGAVGLLVLYVVRDERWQFVFMLLFMTGFYSVQRINYVLSVIFMTPFMLILFHFLGGGSLSIVQERVIDTVVGCSIAFAATYVVFPNWESKQVGQFMQAVLKANQQYLHVLLDLLSGKRISELDYKLARKEVYVSSANLSAAFQRMTGEPKSKQLHGEDIYQFVVLNHILPSYIATIVYARIGREPEFFPRGFLRPLRRATLSLTEALQTLDPSFKAPEAAQKGPEPEILEKKELSSEDQLLRDQLELIRKISAEILKTTHALQGDLPGKGKRKAVAAATV
ncbi:FUSC family membrane protein [Rufibacter glacialis]|uniref:FUSC family membrane protein n=1 Tax=Rufibacter glacialis TaxID=1259555 RepID=A0A5M8Q767_9BACT|nr:FUSC family membrane protein [Rufibacter glacialis]KAA6430726.1 hypothetical protein FOE74_19865 [Rufibacter glacialis]GGK86211.1 hypothetical protein GCM10011405_37480 [Rufibacter glacialis]